MKVRRLDANHDWTFGGGLRNYARDSEAIAQNVRTALLSLYSDWFMDLEHGVRWFRYLTKNPDLQAMETELKNTVLNVDGVSQLTGFEIDLDPDTRQGTVSVTYTDIFNKANGVNVGSPDY